VLRGDANLGRQRTLTSIRLFCAGTYRLKDATRFSSSPPDKRSLSGEWVRYATPADAGFASIVAFSPSTVHRDE
ncbi:MAG TPA: hypothetical protein VFQ03_13135, partial [Candidatus Binatia bacterium]|nr:hypothetical protein [Candidatus Binatia bacterium]